MITTRTTKLQLAERAWGLMFAFFVRTHPQRTAALASRGLTPNDSRGLNTLDTEQGRTMHSLAEEWGCDASNATWIVNRLERLGLAERRADPDDGRVRLVVLTTEGAATKKAVLAEFHTPPGQLLRLERGELEALSATLLRLLDE
ncbi:MAG TPA: MarR family transcriptional regulator [Gemmatimonadaceae bacterium]|nr:MarR family transcriptional regulator [Gemmatimonadaceae bacterium]